MKQKRGSKNLSAREKMREKSEARKKDIREGGGLEEKEGVIEGGETIEKGKGCGEKGKKYEREKK